MLDIYSVPTHSFESIKARPVKPPFGYYGAKNRISKKIIDLLPPHNAWVEAFCGSAALTFAKSPAPIEVINDLDSQIINLFQQIRTNTDNLCRAIALTPYSREEFELARQAFPIDDPLEKARLFLIGTMMTVNGTIGNLNSGFSFSQSYTRGGKEARVNRWYNLPSRIEKVVERLRGIRIENRDACELINMFANRPATLIYLDPPYFTKRNHRYVIDANDIDFHVKLLKTCMEVKCMILISGYDNELYYDTLRSEYGWSSIRIKTHTRDTSGTDYERIEVLWMNKFFSHAKESGKVPIILTDKEKIHNKINPLR